MKGSSGGGLFLKGLRLDMPSDSSRQGYPFTVEAIRTLRSLDVRAPVTFLAGGNGAGKSTLLQSIAIASDRVPVRTGGGSPVDAVQPLALAIRLSWKQRTRGGFFLRGEDFLEYKKSLVRQVGELEEAYAGLAGELNGYGRTLAEGAILGQRDQLVHRYGSDLDAMSHGESFLAFFRARFTGPGLYLLDEPDTALSPLSVLGLLTALTEMAATGAQFIIATHNPILLAFPGATIWGFDDPPIREVAWSDLEQVTLTRDFLAQPDAYLRRLQTP